MISTTDKAQTLLTEWHRFRTSGACAFIFEIQESKDKLENLAAQLSAGLYCSDPDEIDLICNRFELELNRLKQRVYVDLLVGLQKPGDK